MTTSKTNEKNEIFHSIVQTPLGRMHLCASAKGVCMLEFEHRFVVQKQDIEKRLNAEIIDGKNEHIIQATTELEEYFCGSRKSFGIPLHPVGTEFQKQVWQSLKLIDYGKTVSYLQQAHSMNKPKAVRAVASANGRNKISIILPCHRVIGSNGTLTGYGGGVDAKKWLLDFEASNMTN